VGNGRIATVEIGVKNPTFPRRDNEQRFWLTSAAPNRRALSGRTASRAAKLADP
jgi:hypothetical protein